MWAESDGAKGRRVGGEDLAFSNCLGERIGRGAVGRERQGFVGVGKVAAVVDHTRGASVDESADAMLTGGSEKRAGAEDVGAIEIFVAAPHADFRRDMKNRFMPDACVGYGR